MDRRAVEVGAVKARSRRQLRALRWAETKRRDENWGDDAKSIEAFPANAGKVGARRNVEPCRSELRDGFKEERKLGR